MLANRPPLGWNSWNTFGDHINDALIREMADFMVSQGYLKAGYEYLVIDDCWSERERDPVTGKIKTNTIFKFEETGTKDDGRIVGEWRKVGDITNSEKLFSAGITLPA